MISKKATRIALSGAAAQHADNGYSRHGNFGGSVVRNMFLMYSLDGTNACGSSGEEFEGMRSV